MSYTEADLPNDDGRIYHLALKATDLPRAGTLEPINVILVGDPDRARYCGSQFFDSPREFPHRGILTVVGKVAGSDLEVVIVGTGMGVGATEICLTELLALARVNLKTNEDLPQDQWRPLRVIRVGTCGALQETTVLGTPIITSVGVGLDSCGLFLLDGDPSRCDRTQAMQVEAALKRVNTFQHFPLLKRLIVKILQALKLKSYQPKVPVYQASSSPDVVQALMAGAYELGVVTQVGNTVTLPGFFAAQGRHVVGLRPTFPDIDQIIAAIGPRYLNFEMETAYILLLGQLANFAAGSICVAVAHRPTNTFAPPEVAKLGVDNAVRIAFKAFERFSSTS